MHKTLIIHAFKKAEEERKKRGEKKPSKVDLAGDISNFIKDEMEFGLGEKSYRDYFNEAKKLGNNLKDISIKQLKVVVGLCRFLGYKTYEEFEESIKSESILQKLLVFLKKYKILIILFIITTAIFMVIVSVNRQRWMIWNGSHYIETKFDAEKLQQGLLKVYKEDRIKYFEKIAPDCNTEFFTEEGLENLWYGKNSLGELEYFTDLARHPETGKSLNPITSYMIKKYICEKYP
ncbi:hypothetical protein SAMN04488116_2840 [Flagellimonas flava]|uniref:Uncharacterized protein n=2 Tax=Flagellimonas flava TaxID=570519 RepID=A0A1M5NK37_9FLAO|nr:hypothetical protein SAMN04488116_2840 [Allomuricauda flava]